MEKRQAQLLKLIIEHYIEGAEPVGSQFLVNSKQLPYSAATVRNEMRTLEQEGYLMQPHTSAGRIPTEKGYAFYIENLRLPSKATDDTQMLNSILEEHQGSGEDCIKKIGKQVADMVQNAVIVALTPDRVYYSGMSYLFAQPEFKNQVQAINISQIFDHCESIMHKVVEDAKENGVEILLGKDNPFSDGCSAVITRVGSRSIFSIIGPLRMNYKQSMHLAHFINKHAQLEN